MSANVPALMIEYRPKCMEFMNTMGMGRYVQRSDKITVSTMLSMLHVLDTEGAVISSAIRGAMIPIKNRLQVLGTKISADLAR